MASWKSCLGDDPIWAQVEYLDIAWKLVQIPHNWETYEGYHAVSHGNLHGTAWYRTSYEWKPETRDERLHVFFEGVGSYATVYCNGQYVGEHAGGRTTFTLDLTKAARTGTNILAVRAHHPEKIDDLPFVCGGCWGSPNTEGSQPFGIFRPVWIERTGPVRVQPFGLHILTPDLDESAALVEARVEIGNPSPVDQLGELLVELFDPNGEFLHTIREEISLAAEETRIHSDCFPLVSQPRFWSPAHPHLYRARATLTIDGVVSHVAETTFGMRWLTWPRIEESAGLSEKSGLPAWREPSSSEDSLLSEVLFRNDSSPLQIHANGIHVQLDPKNLPDLAQLRIEIRLAADQPVPCKLFCEIQSGDGTVFFHQHRADLNVQESFRHVWEVPPIHHPALWSMEQPRLHRLVVELQSSSGGLWQRNVVVFGIRATEKDLNLVKDSALDEKLPSEPSPDMAGEKILRLNGEPIFLMGTCEYETLLGCDHAFTDEQIAAEVAMMKSAGFNAFRDAHHPHNLRYYDHWDRSGIVCWTQMGSHIWFDNDRFRANYRQLVAEWVRERRNHPCVIMWGLQNESILPEDFARELRDLIRDLDPSSPLDRPTTTCNGGEGSDWNVPQEWSGTYGGNFNDYDLSRHVLVGEFGAWRSFGVHTEREYQGDENDLSESWACQAMEAKIRLGEQARNKAVGHFHWVFNSFPNPGRSADNFEGPGNHAIGSINNKGLVTAWGQPSDLYYLFRSNFADPTKDPMVYIVSHTWPERWHTPGGKLVRIYSNCESVELFDGQRSLGRQSNPGRGRHFQWKDVISRSGDLRAVGFDGTRAVAHDRITVGPAERSAVRIHRNATPDFGRVLYRVSCGSAENHLDVFGREWKADRPWTEDSDYGSRSWSVAYPDLPADLASVGTTMTPVEGTPTPEIYAQYRYGREQLTYHFATGPGRFRLRLHFTEPWFGVGGSADCRRWRLFDIAVNGMTVERDLDIWDSAGGAHQAFVREYEIITGENTLSIQFPQVRVNQALICAIEVFAG